MVIKILFIYWVCFENIIFKESSSCVNRFILMCCFLVNFKMVENFESNSK